MTVPQASWDELPHWQPNDRWWHMPAVIGAMVVMGVGVAILLSWLVPDLRAMRLKKLTTFTVADHAAHHTEMLPDHRLDRIHWPEQDWLTSKYISAYSCRIVCDPSAGSTEEERIAQARALEIPSPFVGEP